MKLLTDEERAVVQDLGEVWNDLCRIVGVGPTRQPDLDEAYVHIHALQRMVMAQAAARAYPEQFRLMGWTTQDRPPEESK